MKLKLKKNILSLLFFVQCSFAVNLLNEENNPVPVTSVTWSVINTLCKLWWSVATYPDTRKSIKIFFNEQTKNYFDIGKEKYVALTIDDGFNSQKVEGLDLIESIQKKLYYFNAKATFFVTGEHLQNVEPEKIKSLLNHGNELANHNWLDTRYGSKSLTEFKEGFNRTSAEIKKISGMSPVPFYRAPSASINAEQLDWLEQKGYKHILGDLYALDVTITDYDWISSYIAGKVRPGSIIVIHMPEKGFREWNNIAIEKMLHLLKDKGYKVTTLSEMEKMEKHYLEQKLQRS